MLACLSPFISPDQWTPVGFLSLSVPYLATALILYTIFWLIAKPYLALVPFITLLIGWKQLSVIIAWHPSTTFNETKSDACLRLLTWNVRGMYGISNSSYTQHRNRNEIAALVNKLNPDIVCLQEFNNISYMKDPNANNIGLFTEKCPYYFFSEDFKTWVIFYGPQGGE